jgi:hypothetical protein
MSYFRLRHGKLIATPPTILTSSSQTISENSPFSVSLTADQPVTWSIIGGRRSVSVHSGLRNSGPIGPGLRASARRQRRQWLRGPGPGHVRRHRPDREQDHHRRRHRCGRGRGHDERHHALDRHRRGGCLLAADQLPRHRSRPITVTPTAPRSRQSCGTMERTNFRNFTNGQSGGHVRAQYLNMHVATTSMTDGATQSITFSGTDVGGSPLTTTLNVSARTTLDAGLADGRPDAGHVRRGGHPQLSAGQPAALVDQEPNVVGRVTDRMVISTIRPPIRRRNSARDHLFNGLARLVLDGTTTRSIKTQVRTAHPSTPRRGIVTAAT